MPEIKFPIPADIHAALKAQALRNARSMRAEAGVVFCAAMASHDAAFWFSGLREQLVDTATFLSDKADEMPAGSLELDAVDLEKARLRGKAEGLNLAVVGLEQTLRAERAADEEN